MQAEDIARRAEQTARSIGRPDRRSSDLTTVVVELTATGSLQQAEVVARSIRDLDWRAKALTYVAGSLAAAGEHRRAAAIAEQAGKLAESIEDLDDRDQVQALNARVLAEAGQYHQAQNLARSISSPSRQAQELAQIASVMTSGRNRRGTRSAGRPDSQVKVPTQVNGARAEPGREPQQALTPARQTLEARHEAAAACASNHWTMAAALVLKLSSSSWAPLARALHIS
jgi:hypothetical protein